MAVDPYGIRLASDGGGTRHQGVHSLSVQSRRGSSSDRDAQCNWRTCTAGTRVFGGASKSGVSMRLESRRAEGGMAVVAVIVLIAVLFLGGTVMALAISSSLHTVDITSAQDGVHYAAESAVARGVGAIEATQSCPADPLIGINGQDLKIRCQSQLVGGDLLEEDEGAGSGKISIPGGRLDAGACVAPTQLSARMTAWTVIAWRGSGNVTVLTTAPGQGLSLIHI